MAITEWPQSERPRERLLELGACALSDAELLAIFLRVGCPGKTAVDLARDLLEKFGGLREILSASMNDFCSLKGMGLAKYVQFQAILEMSQRHMLQTLERGTALSNPQTTRDYISSRLGDRSYEVFACLFLDNRNQVIAFEELFRGTIDSAVVYPREIVRRSLELNAASVILTHNHPSGIAEPSNADKNITNRIVSALKLVDIRVLDHIIVGDRVTTSFAETGLL